MTYDANERARRERNAIWHDRQYTAVIAQAVSAPTHQTPEFNDAARFHRCQRDLWLASVAMFDNAALTKQRLMKG